jgi:hypothetical protein
MAEPYAASAGAPDGRPIARKIGVDGRADQPSGHFSQSIIATGEEVEHDVREFVGALDLWHVADVGEHMHFGVRHDTSGSVGMMCGQHTIAVAPDDQRGTEGVSLRH